MPKAIALLSGGLDSMLAIRVLQEQNVRVEAIHFAHLFNGADSEKALDANKAAQQLGVPLRIEHVSERILEIVKHPAHGYGSNMNPCIDCRIYALGRAAEVMRESGADFLVTGDVLGERPMSQRRDTMIMIEKEAGVPGLVLHPLSARLLPPTIPEEQGLVARERLLAISGRSRRPQLDLAALLGIDTFPSPAGGCLLTDPDFSARMRDLLHHAPDSDLNDAGLLKIGRHFRIGAGVKAVVGRNRAENGALIGLARDGDLLMEAADHPGATGLIRGPYTDEQVRLAASITAHYGKAASLPKANVRTWGPGAGPDKDPFEIDPAPSEVLASMRVAHDGCVGGSRSE